MTAPAPVPALPDDDRVIAYSISADTGPFDVGFDLYGDSTDYGNWIEVWLNGVLVTSDGYTITSPSGDIATLPRPITDAVVTLTFSGTGTLEIVGARRPRRTSQFAENRGVAARDLNQVVTDLTAQNRETWDLTHARMFYTPPGEDVVNHLPPAADRANKLFGFDAGGSPSMQISSIPPATALPLGDGTAAVGVATKYAREDHVHPAGGAVPSVINAVNPNVNNDASDLAAMRINVNYDAGMLAIANPNFGNAVGQEILLTSLSGQNVYGGGTNAKKTSAALSMTHNAPAAGQRFVTLKSAHYYGMGDAFIASDALDYAGGPGAGDEGQGINAVSYCTQQANITTFAISALPIKTTLNTTITQAITGSQNIQTITVASTVGATIGDWIVVAQAPQSGTDNIEAVQITAVGAGTISGRFINNHANGTTITPALLITPNSTFQLGEQRLLVNLSATPYNTGTVSAISGAGFTGSGTSWTNSIVGGTAANVGAISLASDDVTAIPFDSGKTLRAWYPIVSVSGTTSLAVHSYSTAGDISYKGKGVAAGPTAYTIRPAARILRIETGNLLVCEFSNHTWTVGNTLECSICPWPDVSGFQYSIKAFTPGGTYRSFMKIQNDGFRQFSYGIMLLGGINVTTGNVDQYGFKYGLLLSGVETGIQLDRPKTVAIEIADDTSTAVRIGTPIKWGATGHTITSNFDFGTNIGGIVVNCDFLANSVQVATKTVATLPAPAAGNVGMRFMVNNATATTFWSIVAGGGGNTVPVTSDGTNWRIG